MAAICPFHPLAFTRLSHHALGMREGGRSPQAEVAVHEESGGQKPRELQGIQPLRPLGHTLLMFQWGLSPALPHHSHRARPLLGAKEAAQALSSQHSDQVPKKINFTVERLTGAHIVHQRGAALCLGLCQGRNIRMRGQREAGHLRTAQKQSH